MSKSNESETTPIERDPQADLRDAQSSAQKAQSAFEKADAAFVTACKSGDPAKILAATTERQNAVSAAENTKRLVVKAESNVKHAQFVAEQGVRDKLSLAQAAEEKSAFSANKASLDKLHIVGYVKTVSTDADSKPLVQVRHVFAEGFAPAKRTGGRGRGRTGSGPITIVSGPSHVGVTFPNASQAREAIWPGSTGLNVASILSKLAYAGYVVYAPGLVTE